MMRPTLSLIVLCFTLSACGGIPKPNDPTDNIFLIEGSGTACVAGTAFGYAVDGKKVRIGQPVIWVNRLDHDVAITFEPSDGPFGHERIKIAAKSAQVCYVQKVGIANKTTGASYVAHLSCWADGGIGGPKLIVCPPEGCDD